MAKKSSKRRNVKIFKKARPSRTAQRGSRKRGAVRRPAGAARKPVPKRAAVSMSILPPKGKYVANKAGYSKKEVDCFRALLLRLRDKITGQISFLANDSLKNVDDTPADDRTDDFDREFALNLVSSEHDTLYEVGEALRRIDSGAYGQCDECAKPIERQRIKALPFARLCLKCQSTVEHGRVHFRPFGETIDQENDLTAEVEEPEDGE